MATLHPNRRTARCVVPPAHIRLAGLAAGGGDYARKTARLDLVRASPAWLLCPSVVNLVIGVSKEAKKVSQWQRLALTRLRHDDVEAFRGPSRHAFSNRRSCIIPPSRCDYSRRRLFITNPSPAYPLFHYILLSYTCKTAAVMARLFCPDGSNQIEAKLDKKTAPHFYCSKKEDWFR